MDAHEVVVKIVNRKGTFKTFESLGESIGQTGKPSHLHSHCKVLPFYQAGGDVPGFGSPLIGRILTPTIQPGE
jgi:hypothetical protein